MIPINQKIQANGFLTHFFLTGVSMESLFLIDLHFIFFLYNLTPDSFVRFFFLPHISQNLPVLGTS